MAYTLQDESPTAGTDGRVADRASAVVLAGVQTWRRTGSAASIPFPHFESAANGDGLVQPGQLRGLGSNKVRITGVTMKAAATGTHGYLENGKGVTLDLFVSKTDARGYQGVTGIVTSFEIGHDINDKLCEFSAEVTVDGVFPAFGPIVAP